jgi:serum/glucocorticoid-regulated kinase 2
LLYFSLGVVEVVLSKGYDKAADYWALGCLLYELTLATTPFTDEYITHIYRKIAASEEHLQFPEGTDPELEAVVRRLLTHDPSQRLGNMGSGIADIQNDPFFADIDWKALAERIIVPIFRPIIAGNLDSSNFFDFDEQQDKAGIVNADDVEDDEYTGRQDYFESF